MLKTYRIHAGEPQDGAALVFAESFRLAKLLGFNSCVCDGCDYIDVRGNLIKHETWLKANAADKEKLTKGIPHVVDDPPTCEDCDFWYDELFDGLCGRCSEAGGGDA